MKRFSKRELFQVYFNKYFGTWLSLFLSRGNDDFALEACFTVVSLKKKKKEFAITFLYNQKNITSTQLKYCVA